MNFIVTIVDPSFRKSKKANNTAAPASTSAHVGTQYTKYAGSLFHEESLAILLAIDFCHGWLERAMLPGRDSCRGRGDGGPFHVGAQGLCVGTWTWTWTNPPLLLAGLLPPSLQPPHRLSQADGSSVTADKGLPPACSQGATALLHKPLYQTYPTVLNCIISPKWRHMLQAFNSRGSSYCGSPIRHLQSFYASTH